jgi:hypothetical protein
MNITPREQFGIGSSLKKFVRKIIPNEISKVATVAAPFVAPFNPAVAAAMAGIGSFDQTGSISDAFKRGALTYGGGQLARYIGGAGPQDFSLSAFTPSGFKAGFSSPIGIESGLKLGQYKMFGGPGKTISEVPSTGGVELVGSDVGGNITLAESAGGTADFLVDADDVVTATNQGVGSIIDSKGLETGATVVDVATPGITTTKNSLLSNVRNKDFKGVTENISDLIKKGGRAVFYTPRTNQSGDVVGYDLDKNILLAAGAFGLTYLDAKKIANEAGQDISEEEFSSVVDDAKLAEKKEFYANNLANFFGGKKDGGRIGFSSGGGRMMETFRLLEEAMEKNDTDQIEILKSILRNEFSQKLAKGGRTGFKLGKSKDFKPLQIDPMNEKLEDMLESGSAALPAGLLMGMKNIKKAAEAGKEIFSAAEKTSIIRQLAGRTPKFTEAYKSIGKNIAEIKKVMDEPLKYLKDAALLKEILKLKKAQGGRVNYNMGSEVPVRKNSVGIEELDYRQTGGFVPVGVKEKADDVPAMLSKNEFVMTADAVRGIGNGDVERGAQKLYNVMKQAEKVGRA